MSKHKKNPAAVSLGRKRQRSMTKAEQSAFNSAAAKAGWNLTPEARAARVKKMIAARAARKPSTLAARFIATL